MKYPIGIQTFSKLRHSEYLYIDKTAYIYDLVTQGEVYFFSRPRRFGKSILISTLEALFSGQKALFNDLAIGASDYDFQTYPVIKLEFSQGEFNCADALRHYINVQLDFIATKYQIKLQQTSYDLKFTELVHALYQQTGQAVVILIDEYDKPILNNLQQDSLSEIKKVLTVFYGVIKPLDEYLRFVFITGVSRFAKVSVFSGMNNLTDISMHQSFAALCGVTQQELQQHLKAPIKQLIEQHKTCETQLLTKIKYWYNGYRFHHLAESVYNPQSLLALFYYQEFNNYWFETATPTFLIELIKTNQFDLSQITDYEVDKSFFAAAEPERMKPASVMLQTGYLTIVDYKDGLYRLDFPNYEVKQAFNQVIVEEYSGVDSSELRYLRILWESLNNNDLEKFFDTLKIFFANIPYGITLNHEKYYQSLFYAIFTLIGLNLQAEVQTNQGRIDCVIETDKHIYVIEFKLNGTKEDALAQIKQMNYAHKYQLSKKQIIAVGVEFDAQSRNIGEFIYH